MLDAAIIESNKNKENKKDKKIKEKEEKRENRNKDIRRWKYNLYILLWDL